MTGEKWFNETLKISNNYVDSDIVVHYTSSITASSVHVLVIYLVMSVTSVIICLNYKHKTFF